MSWFKGIIGNINNWASFDLFIFIDHLRAVFTTKPIKDVFFFSCYRKRLCYLVVCLHSVLPVYGLLLKLLDLSWRNTNPWFHLLDLYRFSCRDMIFISSPQSVFQLVTLFGASWFDILELHTFRVIIGTAQ